MSRTYCPSLLTMLCMAAMAPYLFGLCLMRVRVRVRHPTPVLFGAEGESGRGRYVQFSPCTSTSSCSSPCSDCTEPGSGKVLPNRRQRLGCYAHMLPPHVTPPHSAADAVGLVMLVNTQPRAVRCMLPARPHAAVSLHVHGGPCS